jgi:DNA polymerase-3 subunit delta'
VNCEAEADRPCGTCTSCRQIELGVHSDVRQIRPDGSSIKLQQVRNLLAEATLTPNVGPYRVFIVENAERLTREAANALLMMLEEPPHFDLFILTATSPLLPTIESRCQALRFKPAALSQTGQTADVASQRAHAERLLLAIVQTPLGERAQLVDELEKADVDLSGLLAQLLLLYRDLAVWQLTQDPELLLNRESTLDLYVTAAQGAGDFFAGSQAILDVQRRLQNNVNKRLALEYLLYSL